MREPQEGRYAISEVGDLGMGLTPITEEKDNIEHETEQTEKSDII